MSGFGGYSGQAFSPAGDKGRYVLPPAFRKAVKESGAGSKILCLAKHDRWQCLVGFGLSRKDEFDAQLEKEEERALKLGRDFDYDERSSQLHTFLEVPFDDSGRFIMPDYLRGLASISDSLYFQGGGRFFTIWDPAELAKMGDSWAMAKAACASLQAEAAAKGKAKGGKS